MLSKRRAAAKIPVYPYCHPTVELLHYYTPHVRDSSHRNGKTSSPILPLIIIRTSGHYGFLKADGERNNKIGEDRHPR